MFGILKIIQRSVGGESRTNRECGQSLLRLEGPNPRQNSEMGPNGKRNEFARVVVRVLTHFDPFTDLKYYVPVDKNGVLFVISLNTDILL